MIDNKINKFSNPFIIFFMFVVVSLVNIILPVHFISIFLAGIVFMAFIECVKQGYWYSLVFVILSFVFIETSHGLNIGVLSLLSFFIYAFIIPKLKYILKSKTFYILVVNIIFYLGIVILFKINGNVDSVLISKIVLNFFIDIFLVSFI